MEEIGVVKSVDGDIAVVSVHKKPSCEGCGSGACHIAQDDMLIEATNRAEARVGQKVIVNLNPSTYLTGSFMVYGVPTIALIAGAVTGKNMFPSGMMGMDAELSSAVVAFGFFLLSFIFVKAWSSMALKNEKDKPVVEAIIDENHTGGSNG